MTVKITAKVTGKPDVLLVNEDLTSNIVVSLEQSINGAGSTTLYHTVVEPASPVIITPPPTTTTTTPTTSGNLIYDSHLNSKLHDSKVRTVDKEGTITPNGLGIECHASGSPKIVVNNDGTFSLVCSAGHGRFYLYALNYNSKLSIEFAFWNEAPGQDCSLKLRSRHNEGDPPEHRFGGYGCSIDRTAFDAKREIYHNSHDQSQGGSLPTKINTKEYHILEFSVKDESGKVKQTATLDGKQFLDKTDSTPKAYMLDKASFAAQSYLWVRQNLDSGNGEIRIKSLKLTAL